MAAATLTEQQMLKGIDQLQQQLKAQLDRPADLSSRLAFGGGNGAGYYGGPFSPHSSREWPVAALNHLAKAYPGQTLSDINMRRRNGTLRLSGIGPQLVRMAAISGNPEAQKSAQSQGLWSPDYTDERLEADHGFVSFTKACTSGISGDSEGGSKFWGMEKGQVRKAALAEGSGQTGGYLVPPQFQTELLTIAGEEAFVESRCKKLPMTTRQVFWPMLDITTAQAAGTTPYAGGVLATWQPEAATISETEPQFKQTTWTAWDLVLYTVSSNQLLADNGIGLDALLTELFGWALQWYKEYAFLQGAGAGSTMPLGVLNAPATLSQAKATAAHFKLQDAAAMMSHLQIRSWDDACWVMHQSVLPELIQLSDVSATLPGTAGQHITWLPPLGQDGLGPAALKLPRVFLNGLPIYFTEKLPKLGTNGCVLLADFSKYVVGERLDIQIDISPHYLFRSGQLAWRVIARCDGKPWLNSSVVDQAGWSISPFVYVTQ